MSLKFRLFYNISTKHQNKFMAYILFFILSFFFYIKGRKGEVLFCLIAILSNCFGFLDQANIKPTDLILSFSIGISICEFIKNHYFFQTKNDIFGKLILLILFYIFLNFAFTVLLHLETFSFALKVVRYSFVFLLYFYFRDINQNEIDRFIRLALIASTIQGVFYYLQLVGVNVLSGRVDEAEDVGEITRYANYPRLVGFFILYYITTEKSSLFLKLFFITFYGFMLVLGQMRGGILALAFAICVFFLLKHKAKYILYIVGGVIVFQTIINPMFEYRTRNAERSTLEEVKMVLSNPTAIYESYTEDDESGNFLFRIAMLSERAVFMKDNPQYLPFGVGCIHEESPNNTFFFHLGTHNEMYKYGYGLLSSADIAWVGILMRYGLVGVLLFLLLLFAWFKTSIPLIRKCAYTPFVVAALMSITCFLGTFSGDNLGRIPAITNMLFYLAVIHSYKRVNN